MKRAIVGATIGTAVACPLGLRSHVRLCPLHRKWDDVYAATEDALARVTIADLISSTSDIMPLTESPR